MQFAVCIESICTIQTDSAHTVHSWVGFCILHLHCAFCTTLFWPLLPILGEFLHSAPTSCIGTLSALSWLWVSFAFRILHPASCTSLTAVALGPLLHSAFCILHAKTHPQPGESGQSTDAGCRCRMQKLAQYR